MKLSILIVATIFNYSLFAKEKNPQNFFKLKQAIGKVSKKNLQKTLRSFVKSSRPGRMVGSLGHKAAQEYIYTFLNKNAVGEGTSVEKHIFKPNREKAIAMYQGDFQRDVVAKFKPSNPVYKMWDKAISETIKFIHSLDGTVGTNIIWTKKGTNPEAGTIYIGAHYDTMATDPSSKQIKRKTRQPGADDNGSGVSVALEMARLMSLYTFEQTIKIVFFDWEEIGFLGSEAYVREKLPSLKKNYLGYINLEMIGYDSKLSDTEKKNGNMKIYIRRASEPGHKKDASFAKEIMSTGEALVSGVHFEVVANSFNASDHLYFWEAGLPAITFTENWETDFNPNYHTDSDIPESLNMKTLHSVFLFVSAGVMGKLLKLKK